MNKILLYTFGLLMFLSAGACKSKKPIDNGAAERAKKMEQLEKDKKSFEQKNKKELGQ
ncbi:MAG: hypothetical protein MUE96_07705 [Bacteroidia bacterium]|jgi:hypothetical protein|nr:hypothetical protein [Bacteroidia bacterium]